MRISYLLLLSFAILGLASCSKDNEVPTTSTDAPEINRRLVIEVSHVYDRQQRLDSLLPNVTVKLFQDPLDRDEDTDIVVTGVTDVSGKATFSYLKEKTYYVRVEHPDFQSIRTEFTYPKGAVTSYEYYDFY